VRHPRRPGQDAPRLTEYLAKGGTITDETELLSFLAWVALTDPQRSHVDYLAQLVEGETALRESRSIERRVRNARFPVLKTIEDFQWSWPRKIVTR
jgi:hypothetical protein